MFNLEVESLPSIQALHLQNDINRPPLRCDRTAKRVLEGYQLR